MIRNPEVSPNLYYYFIFFLFCAFCAIWAAADAIRRERNPYLVGFLVLFLGPIGWLGWLIMRPSTEEQAVEVDEAEYQRLKKKAAK